MRFLKRETSSSAFEKEQHLHFKKQLYKFTSTPQPSSGGRAGTSTPNPVRLRARMMRTARRLSTPPTPPAHRASTFAA